MGSSVVQVYLVHNLRATFLQFYARMYIAIILYNYYFDIVSDVRYKLRGNFTIIIYRILGFEQTGLLYSVR